MLSENVTLVANFEEEDTPDPIPGMVLVNGGTFQMGDEYDVGSSDEKPVHTVTLTHDYYIGTYELTNAEFVQFLNSAGVELKYGDDGYIEDRRIIDIDNGVYSGIDHNGTSWVLNYGKYLLMESKLR